MTGTGQAITLTEILDARLRDSPRTVACVLVDGDGRSTPVSVEDLMERVMAYAARFGRSSGTPKVVGVCLYHGLDLLAAFLGGLWAGHVPTMLAPPSPRMEPTKYVGSIRRMLDHVQPHALVVDDGILAKLGSAGVSSFAEVDIVDPARVARSGRVAPWAASPDDVAALQHSSGTTGLQKGVALSHRAIAAHNEAYADRLEIGSGDVVVSWLPLYHDMGFIACFLLPLSRGIPFVHISPFDWVLRPSMLLEQIDRHTGTLCWLPNFAYSFLAENARSETGAAPNLGTLRAWVNCSEPVLPASHAAFLARFGAYGVKPGSLTASYAMAENVFAVTQSLPGRYRTLTAERATFERDHRVEPAGQGVTFVSTGMPLPTTEVTAIGADGSTLGEGWVGELAIRGSHTFSGYFRRDDLTSASITEDGRFKTGDLGFLLDGEVYVTGRKKDLVIIQGRNFYPGDVESVAMRVPGVAAGRVVAFGVPDEASGTERLVVLAEADEAVPGEERRLALRVRNAIAQELDCTPGDVRVVPSRWLVKSTSGKMARPDNRAKYLETIASRVRSGVTKDV